MAISDLEMALSLDDFSKTILEPAMAQLAAQINMTQSMRYISTFQIMLVTVSTQLDYKNFQQAGQVLTENLAPSDLNVVLSKSILSNVEF